MSGWDWVSKLSELSAEGREAVLVTVTAVTGSAPRHAGAKMIVCESEFHGTIGGGRLEELALQDARALLKASAAGAPGAFAGRVSGVKRYPLGAKAGQCCGGVVDLFFEPLNQGPRLYVFGAGHVGQAICRVFEGTSFKVHVFDEREEWLQSPLLPASVIRHGGLPTDALDDVPWSARQTYVAILTHRHDLDESLVEAVIQRPARYIGLIGSAAKWARFRQRFDHRGVDRARVERVKCPIGLGNWGKAPQEVAISLAAELLMLEVPCRKALTLNSQSRRTLLGSAGVKEKSLELPLASTEKLQAGDTL